MEKNHEIIRYTYDPFHRRLKKKRGGTTHSFLYQFDDEIGSAVNQEIKELRLLENGRAIAIELQGNPYVPVHDAFENITSLLDFNGHVAATYRYTAFGEEEVQGLLTPWRFAGKRIDSETDFIYFGRRYYMPEIGRWLTPDPLWFEDGPNLYTYVHNHPLAYTDPDGQFAFLLVPLAISLVAEYCLPTAAVYLSQYAGGALAASFLTGMATGYSDPLSSAFDAGTYSIGDLDATSFMSNRAGMLLGAAISCSPSKQGTNFIRSAGSMALAEVSGAIAAQTEKAVLRQVMKGGSTKAAQKTAQVAEQYMVKGGMPSLDKLSRAGQVMDRGGLTKAGRALDKHGGRPGSVFSKATGNPANKNIQGQFHLDDILTNPISTIERYNRPRFGEVIDIKIPGERGVRYSADGNFIGFLNP